MPTELFGTLRGQIVAGENIEMDIRLLGVGDVEVLLVNPDGTPVVGASMTLTTAFPRDGSPQVVLTDANGLAIFRHVIEGPYSVSASLLGTPRWASMRHTMTQNPAVDHQDSHTLVLPTVDGDGSGNESQVFGSIEGTILDEDSDGNQVTVLEPTSVTLYTGTHVAMTLSDTSDGMYRFENVPAGDFTLSARDEVFGRRAFGAGRIEYGNSNVLVNLQFIGLGEVSGLVKDSSGQAVAGAFVRAEPSGAAEQPRETLTNSEGRFGFSGLPLGEVQLTAAGINGVLRAEARVVLRERGDLVSAELQLEPGYSVSGTVRLENGSPAGNALVEATMAGRPSRRVNCDAEGNFSFSQLFPPGRLSLNASLEARQAVVTVDLDGSTATLNQAMTLSGQGSVRARLVTSEGQALPGAEARLISSRTSQVRFTDPDGSVRFDAVPAGDVEVSFQSPNSLVERALWQGTLAAEGQVVDAGDVALEAMAAIFGTLGTNPVRVWLERSLH